MTGGACATDQQHACIHLSIYYHVPFFSTWPANSMSHFQRDTYSICDRAESLGCIDATYRIWIGKQWLDTILDFGTCSTDCQLLVYWLGGTWFIIDILSCIIRSKLTPSPNICYKTSCRFGKYTSCIWLCFQDLQGGYCPVVSYNAIPKLPSRVWLAC